MSEETAAMLNFREKVRKAGPFDEVQIPVWMSVSDGLRVIKEERERMRKRAERDEQLLVMAGVIQHDYTKKTAELLAKPDPVNSPSHYNTGGIECFDAMSAMLTREEMIGYLRGNSFKYRWRFRHKGGAEDLRKAEWYEKKLLDLIENSA